MRILLLLAVILLASCSQPEIKVYEQGKFANVTESPYEVCDINGVDYYTYGVFIYHENDIESDVVYAPPGEYLKPKDYPRWQLRPYNNKNVSTYVDTRQYIQEGLPNGVQVSCEEAVYVPPAFRQFIQTHEKLYEDKMVIEFD